MYCPYLKSDVELAKAQHSHIIAKHSELLPDHPGFIEQVLLKPEVIRQSTKDQNAFLFSRWYSELMGGKHVVVVVKKEPERCWIITAFIARRLSGGILLWTHHI